jgi:uncharacterized membrane protein
MLTLVMWIVYAPHGLHYPTALMLIVFVVPLLFPLRGLLHAKPYTHAWTSFLMLFYFTIGVGEYYADNTSLYGLSCTLLSALCFCSCIAFVKAHAKNAKKISKQS